MLYKAYDRPGNNAMQLHAAANFRGISIARLCRRRLCTCNLSTSSSPTPLKGYLILEQASRLDAFSAYPFHT